PAAGRRRGAQAGQLRRRRRRHSLGRALYAGQRHLSLRRDVPRPDHRRGVPAEHHPLGLDADGMTMRVPAYRFWRDTRGATAMELALLLPVFVMLIFGLINTSLMAGALSGMHYAVEE